MIKRPGEEEEEEEGEVCVGNAGVCPVKDDWAVTVRALNYGPLLAEQGAMARHETSFDKTVRRLGEENDSSIDQQYCGFGKEGWVCVKKIKK